MQKNTRVIIFLFTIIKCALGTNILFFSPIPSPSHHIFNRVLGFALAEKGYNVTFVGHDVEKEKHPNFNFILLEGIYDHLTESFDMGAIMNYGPLQSIKEMYDWCELFCEQDYKTKGLNFLMDYPKDFKFDLIIYDVTAGQCLYAIIDRFNKPPVVGITAFLLPHYLSNAMGSHVYPSYYPHYDLQVSNKMNFLQRAESFLLTYGENWYRNNIFMKNQNELMKSYFGDKARPASEYEREIALLLSNTDPLLDYPIALPPNIIPVGGMHVKPPKPLPNDLKTILDESKNGVILFSLGTNLLSIFLQPEVKEELMAGFAMLKETVIWKYEDELEGLPKNVITKKWLPQSDILGHKNCKLFISHGGALSTQEAMYHGVPVVGIPAFADQHKNVLRLVTKGLGLKIDFANVKRDVVHQVVREVLDNPVYRTNMLNLSKKFKDQPQTPLERAVFWTEYVLRHGGAKDLELPARDMCFIQTTNIDVVVFLLAGVLSVVFVVFKVVKKLFCGQQKKKDKLKRN